MDRASLKFDAKASMSQACVNPYVVTIIVGIITIILSVIQGGIDTWGQMISGSYGYAAAAEKGAYVITSIIFFLITMVVSTIFEFGYYSYCLKVANRDVTMSYGDLFSPLKYFFKALGLQIVTSVFIFLWTLLFIIPGIIAAYRYSQVKFILVENPDKGIMECIRESKEMMAGHKMEYFVLGLSFILWNILAVFTCGLAYIYVYPYTMVTYANYYNGLKPVTVGYEEI